MRHGNFVNEMSMKQRQYGKVLATAMLVVAVMASGMSAVQAQTSGKLRLVVDPGDSYEFVLDHQFRMQKREVELLTGPHHFSFWAPERSIVDTTITMAGRTSGRVM